MNSRYIPRHSKAPSSRKAALLITVTLTAAVALAAAACTAVLSQRTLSLTLTGGDNITLEYGESFRDPGATAQYSPLFGKARTLSVETSGSVDSLHPGTYTLTYRASTQFSAVSCQRTVTVVDTEPPELTLIDSGTPTPAGQDYVEEGYTASDNVDGDLTDQVVRHQADGTVYYSVTDSSGNTTSVTRTILYQDSQVPFLALTGGNQVTISPGAPFSDPGYTAQDAQDGDLTGQVTVDGILNYFAAGTYTLTYSVTDSDGNTASAQRSVTVDGDYTPEDHRVYLTFDDGPGAYTQELLDVLAKYNVKATFFVTNAYPAYESMIAAEAAAGHSIGVHSTTHQYAQIYASPSAFFEDLNTMNTVIEEQTGTRSHFLRFPGGSSNTISAKYCPGIMTQLAQQVSSQGYIYFDWNVLSGDAGETTSTQVVIDNVISGIQSHPSAAVVLQHDVKDFSVDAVESILQWGLANGYCFLPITDDTPPVQHHINN